GTRRALFSFPTRRSSDLAVEARIAAREVAGVLAAIEDAGDGPAVVLLAGHGLAFDAQVVGAAVAAVAVAADVETSFPAHPEQIRSEEHTSELQSRENLVC